MTDITIEDFCVGNLQETPLSLFIQLISTLVAAKCSLGSDIDYPDDYGMKLQNGDEFDFIVIGAGSGGSLLANKLTENKNWKVLVLEAGGIPSDTSDLPFLSFNVQGTSNDWQHTTQATNSSCLGFTNTQCKIPKGKALGGTSALNDMTYIKGYQRDYDKWAENGNNGWGWNDVKNYFNYIENIQAPDDLTTSMGVGGLLPLLKLKNHDPITLSLKEAFNSLSIPYREEQDPTKIIGILETPLCIQSGMRANIGKTILGTIRRRQNLFVSRHTLVDKIVINPENMAVSEVRVRIGLQTLLIKARKEVILSAGTINSPQILMLSGIGPEEHLKQHNISLIKNLPVGENLQDHLFFTGFSVKLDLNALLPRDPIDIVYEYFKHRNGLLSTAGIANFLSFITTKNDSNVPNVSYRHIIFSASDDILLPAVTKAFGMEDDIVKAMEKANKYDPVMMILPGIVNPKSRGKVLLKSNNIEDKPLIYPEYMTDAGEEDIQNLLEGIRFAKKLFETTSLKQHLPELLHLPIPNCDEYKFNSDGYWTCALRHLSTTFGDLTSTCAMGPKDDGTSVVDTNLKVHGIKNLRVVDASIIPSIVSSGTQATTMMIGYKAALMIKNDWSVQHEEL
ncbi:glucose dehydrogenase [FAD, quinone]-like [Diabrotica undecimpunctata]|uniref:glucose dehydrogenase [FAD, quinone]-like n=1 Tax=Diabrotica undecimpunctata TaxID=50387 RepID=UPI003B63C78C